MTSLREIGNHLNRGYRDDLNWNFSKLEAMVGESKDLTNEVKQELLADIQKLRELVESFNIDEIHALIKQMNEKIIEANTATLLAIEKAGLADESATKANEKATLANEKAIYAQEKGDYANEKAILANGATERAEQEISNLSELKTNVVNATQGAITVTEKAIEATTKAAEATQNATDIFNELKPILPNVEGLENVGIYDASTAYRKNNIVEYNGSSFQALKDTTGNTPPTLPTKLNEFWVLVAQRGIDGEGSVSSVNGKLPTVGGNVVLVAEDVGAEPTFEKNTAFNKNFGIEAGTVAEGNHTHAISEISKLEETLTNLQNGVDEAKQYASNGKTLVANATTGKGVPTLATDSWEKIATNIGKIKTGYGAYDRIPKDKIKLVYDSKWSYSQHGGLGITAIEIDKEGNVYSANTNNLLVKLSAGGDEVWRFAGFTSTVQYLRVDNEGNVYGCCLSGTVRKINSAGEEVWKYTNTDSVGLSSISQVLSTGESLWVGDSKGWLINLRAIDGSEISRTRDYYRGTVRDCCIDTNDIFYSCAETTVMKGFTLTSNPSDPTKWMFTKHSGSVMSVTVDSVGNVYSCDATGVVKKISPTGTEVWSQKITTNSLQRIRLDSKGNIYCSDNRGNIYKLDNYGDIIIQYTWKSNSVVKIAVDDQYVYASANKPQVEKLEEVYMVTAVT